MFACPRTGPPSSRRAIEPAASDPLATLRSAIERPVAGPAAARPRAARPAGRHLRLRHHAAPAAGADAPGAPGAAGRRDPARGRHRSSSRPARTAPTRPTSWCAMLGPDVVDTAGSSTTTPAISASLVDLGTVGDVPVLLERAGSRPTCASRPASWSRTSSRASAAGRRWSRRAWPASRPCSRCTTPRRIGDPRATWGVIEGNPVHDAVRAIAAATGVDFALDVLLNDEHRITRAFGGELLAMHAAACAEARARGDAAGRARVRRRRHHEQRLSRSTRTCTRRSRACPRRRRSSGRAARSSARPSAATACPTTAPTAELLAVQRHAGRAAGDDRGVADAPSPTSGRSRSRRASSSARVLLKTRRAAADAGPRPPTSSR